MMGAVTDRERRGTRELARRRLARRVIVIGLVTLQLGMVVRAYWAPHREFGFQMFPESSQWQAEVVRITADGERVPVTEPWSGYRWRDLVDSRGLAVPDRRHHADAGVENQLAFLQEAIDWVAANTPRDTETVRYEAGVVVWPNLGDAERRVLVSHDRELP